MRRGKTMRSVSLTRLLTPLRSMSMMSRTFFVPSSRTLVAAAIFDTTGFWKRACTSAQDL